MGSHITETDSAEPGELKLKYGKILKGRSWNKACHGKGRGDVGRRGDTYT